jgi:hypothetical protein
MQNASARSPRDEDDRHVAPRRLRLVEAGSEAEYAPTYAPNGRRTVKITGQPVPARRRPNRTATQIQARPDRIALWAFLLGLFLVFMAVATASASTL